MFQNQFLLLTLLLGAGAAQANTAYLEVNKPITLTYKVARQKNGEKPVYDTTQTLNLDKKLALSLDLAGYDFVGIVPVAINDFSIPADVTEFNKPNRCSITTNKDKSSGNMLIETKEHQMNCKIAGGVFG